VIFKVIFNHFLDPKLFLNPLWYSDAGAIKFNLLLTSDETIFFQYF